MGLPSNKKWSTLLASEVQHFDKKIKNKPKEVV